LNALQDLRRKFWRLQAKATEKNFHSVAEGVLFKRSAAADIRWGSG
jgi:hypothetical protein